MSGLELPFHQFVLRRVPARYFDPDLQPAAFHLRPSESGLSVYRADIRTPRSLLQQYVDDLKRRLESAQDTQDAKAIKSAQKLIERDGDVEKLVANGWRVVIMPLSVFNKVGLVITDPEPKDSRNPGHINVVGTPDRFETHSIEWITPTQSKVLSASACLDDDVFRATKW